MTTIHLYGDSTQQGAGDRLARCLREPPYNKSVTVVNKGIGGLTTRVALFGGQMKEKDALGIETGRDIRIWNDQGVSVSLLSVDGVITSTGITEEGIEFVPTWTWTPAGDKVTVLMVPRGAGIPDTRPAVVVIVQETESSDPIEFILTAPAGSGRPG